MILDWRTYTAGAAVVLALVFGGLWLHGRDSRLKAEGQLALQTAELDSAKVRSARAVARADSAAAVARAEREVSDRKAAEVAATLVRERVARAAAQERAEAAIARAPAKADTIVLAAVSGDTAAVRERVRELLDVQAEERAGWLGVIRSDSIVIRELRALDATRVEALVAADARDAARVAAMDSLTVRAEAAEAALATSLKARPGWLERTGWKVAIPVAIAGGWYARGKLGG